MPPEEAEPWSAEVLKYMEARMYMPSLRNETAPAGWTHQSVSGLSAGEHIDSVTEGNTQ
jgi:hypothetical protein